MCFPLTYACRSFPQLGKSSSWLEPLLTKVRHEQAAEGFTRVVTWEHFHSGATGGVGQKVTTDAWVQAAQPPRRSAEPKNALARAQSGLSCGVEDSPLTWILSSTSSQSL